MVEIKGEVIEVRNSNKLGKIIVVIEISKDDVRKILPTSHIPHTFADINRPKIFLSDQPASNSGK